LKIEVITYEPMERRVQTIKRVLSKLSTKGVSAQLAHPSETTARALQELLGVNAVSTHTLAYTPVDAECVVLVDGDIISRRAVLVLEALGKDVYVLVPREAFPGLPGTTLSDIRKTGVLVPQLSAGEEPRPRTFACHHNAETCMACEGLVVQWKSDRRDSAERSDQNQSN
jgi:hypothetical protein